MYAAMAPSMTKYASLAGNSGGSGVDNSLMTAGFTLCCSALCPASSATNKTEKTDNAGERIPVVVITRQASAVATMTVQTRWQWWARHDESCCRTHSALHNRHTDTAAIKHKHTMPWLSSECLAWEPRVTGATSGGVVMAGPSLG